MQEKNTSTLLSIVIPCYNAMPYIQETLEGILDWPSDLVEIVVQDGGSTDGTLEYLERQGERINLQSKQDRGQTDALNTGIRRASGKYIGWLNADDLYTPDMWSKTYPILMEASGPDLIYGNYSIIYGNGDIMRTIEMREFDWSSYLHKGRPAWSGAMLWHRSVFDRFGFFDESLHYCMDMEFFLRVSGSVSARFVPYELGRFRVHEGSKTGSKPWAFFRENHRIRWNYVGDDKAQRVNVLIADAKQIVYYATKGLRESRAYSTIRRTHRF